MSSHFSFATSVNQGLAQSFNFVGTGLFGSAVFGAKFFPADSVRVQMDLATDVLFPTAASLFVPPKPISPKEPCLVVAKFRAGGDGTAALMVDSAVLNGEVDYEDLPAIGPNVARCPAPTQGLGDG